VLLIRHHPFLHSTSRFCVSTPLSFSSSSNSTADHQPCHRSHSLSTLPALVCMRGSRWSREVCARSRRGWQRVCGLWARCSAEVLMLVLELAQFVDVYAVRYPQTVGFVVSASYHRLPASTPSELPYHCPPCTIGAKTHYHHKLGTHTQAKHSWDAVVALD
jgi:hypothetical protein